MKKRVMTLFLLGVLGVGLSGCVVLDRHGRVNSRATAVANGLLIGAGAIGLGIAAHEADVHETRVRVRHRSHHHHCDRSCRHESHRCRTVRFWRH